jgi:hypothetical protein
LNSSAEEERAISAREFSGNPIPALTILPRPHLLPKSLFGGLKSLVVALIMVGHLKPS